MFRLGFPLLIIGLMTCHGQIASSVFAQAETGEKELQTAIDNYVAAYNSGQIDQVMSFWNENADFVDIRGRFHEGRELISALFRRGFADNPGRTMKLDSASRKFLSDDVAMDDGILELTSSDGTKNRGRYTVVWTRSDGTWRIRSARDIPIEVEPTPEESQTNPMEELAWLIGKWEADSGDAKILLTCDWALDQRFLVQTFDVKSGDETFRVVTYIGFDSSEAKFRSWFFDSRGGFGAGAWTRVDDQYQIATDVVLPEGQLGSLMMIWQKGEDETLNWQAVERTVDGEPLPESSQTYRRAQ